MCDAVLILLLARRVHQNNIRARVGQVFVNNAGEVTHTVPNNVRRVPCFKQ